MPTVNEPREIANNARIALAFANHSEVDQMAACVECVPRNAPSDATTVPIYAREPGILQSRLSHCGGHNPE